MLFILDGIKTLSSSYRKIEVIENFDRFYALYQLTSLNTEGSDNFYRWLNAPILDDENLSVSIKIGPLESIDFNRGGNRLTFNERIELLNDKIDLAEPEDDTIITINIRKNVVSSHRSESRFIYSLDDLTSNLRSLDLQSLTSFLPANHTDFNRVTFKVLHETNNFASSIFDFTSIYPAETESCFDSSLLLKQKDYERLHENRDKCAHFANASLLKFIPDDFMLYEESSNEELNQIFNGLLAFYLLVFLADFSTVSTRLHIRLKGYKLITEDFNFTKLKNSNPSELYKIYKWVYGSGNFTDKIGLARNLITIHLSSDSLLSVESDTVHSLTSGYDMYLKENVKQYIEVKSKLSEAIQSSSDEKNIKSIQSDDETYKSDEDYLKEMRKTYKRSWLLMNLLLVFVVTILWHYSQ